MPSAPLAALGAHLTGLTVPLADLLDQSKGPSESGDFSVDPSAFVILMLVGFLVGAGGHLFKSKTMIVAGVLMIFLATVGLPIYLSATN